MQSTSTEFETFRKAMDAVLVTKRGAVKREPKPKKMAGRKKRSALSAEKAAAQN
jgi:hypothetical protein